MGKGATLRNFPYMPDWIELLFMPHFTAVGYAKSNEWITDMQLRSSNSIYEYKPFYERPTGLHDSLSSSSVENNPSPISSCVFNFDARSSRSFFERLAWCCLTALYPNSTHRKIAPDVY